MSVCREKYSPLLRTHFGFSIHKYDTYDAKVLTNIDFFGLSLTMFDSVKVCQID